MLENPMVETRELPREQPANASPCATSCGWERRLASLVPWGAQVVVSLIFAQTLFFKVTYAPETQVIFADRGGYPAALTVGMVELVCVILLLIPRLAAFGAVLSLLTISGALFTHLTALGISMGLPARTRVGTFCRST